jgi:hypothetical protein
MPNHWPDYVVYDWQYKQAKCITDQAQLTDWIQGIKKDYSVQQWSLQTIHITLDIFTQKTQKMIKKRKGGTVNPYKVPKDAERHAIQAALLEKNGISREPIIVFKTKKGYELVEGWHRTIQALNKYPQGYVGPAWVGLTEQE